MQWFSNPIFGILFVVIFESNPVFDILYAVVFWIHFRTSFCLGYSEERGLKEIVPCHLKYSFLFNGLDLFG